MSDLDRKQQRGFGRRILTDSTAVFRLKDIEAGLAGDKRASTSPKIPVQPPRQPVAPPPMPVEAAPALPQAPRPNEAPAREERVDLSVIAGDERPTAEITGRLPTKQAQRIVFFASKGGVGATVCAAHVAGALTKLGHRVCLVDMDLQMGSTAFALGVQTTRSLANLAQAVKLGEDAVADFPMAQHDSGVYLLDQPDLAEVGEVGPDGLPNVMSALSDIFDYVLIDGLRDFGDHAIVTMDEAHQIIIVANDDVPSLRCGLRAKELFRRLGYASDTMRLMLNKNSDDDATFIAAVTQAFGRDIDWIVPQMSSVPECVNAGQLLSDSDEHSADALVFENIARDIAGLPRIEPEKKGFLKRLFKRGS